MAEGGRMIDPSSATALSLPEPAGGEPCDEGRVALRPHRPRQATTGGHAGQGGFPANRVPEVEEIIDPTTAEARRPPCEFDPERPGCPYAPIPCSISRMLNIRFAVSRPGSSTA